MKKSSFSFLILVGVLFGFSPSLQADVSDLVADGSFSFLTEGSLVVTFYGDEATGNVIEKKYLQFEMNKSGRVSSIGVKKCCGSAGNGWVRQYSERERVATLKDFLGKARWDLLNYNLQKIVANLNAQLANGRNRFTFTRASRAAGSSLFDPTPTKSFSIAIITGNSCSMRREIYDADGGVGTVGTSSARWQGATVTESWRAPSVSTPASLMAYQAPIRVVVNLLAEYLNTYYSYKK